MTIPIDAQTVDAQDRVWVVSVEWRPGRGRFEPASVKVTCSSGGVTADSIRKLPLGTLFVDMQAHMERLMSAVADAARYDQTAGDLDRNPDAAWREPYRAVAQQFSSQRGRPRSPALLEAVAATYRHAWERRLPVTRAVANATNCSVSTAGKRIMAARKAGLLEGIGDD